MYFTFDFGWYSIHFHIVCQEQGGLLNGQNPLSVTKVICRQSLILNNQNLLNIFCQSAVGLSSFLLSSLLSQVQLAQEKFYNRNSQVRQRKLWYSSFCYSPVLLTKFRLSVSSVRSPSLIENLTISPSDFQNSALGTQSASQLHSFLFLFDFGFSEEPAETERKFEVELLCFNMFFTNKFYI